MPDDDKPSRAEVAEAVASALTSGYAIVCWTKCWACQFDEHQDPPFPHTWGDEEDFAHAKATGQPEPGNCACWCAKLTPEQESVVAPQIAAMVEGAEERRKQPATPDDLDEIRRRIEAAEKEH